MRIPLLLPTVLAVLVLSTGCVTIAPNAVSPAGGLLPRGERLATVAPGPGWPDPVQPPARETLAPAYGPATATATSAATSHPAARPGPGQPQHEPAVATSRHPHRVTGRPPAVIRRSSPARHRPHQVPRPYNTGAVCSWAQGTGFDPSVVRACRQQLGR